MSLTNTKLFPTSPAVEYEDGSVQITFTVSENLVFCDGHFPAAPLVPGAVLAAWMREAARLAGFVEAGGYVKNLKFRAPVVPGDSVMIVAVPNNTGIRVTLKSTERLCADATFLA